MQWAFLVLGLLAAMAEMHTGTIYLAGVAAAALLTAGSGFWLPGNWLIFVFVVLCAAVTILVMLTRRRRMLGQKLVDFDIGQTVSVRDVSHPDNRLIVTYRGTIWEATMEDGAAVAPGDNAVIVRKTDKLLHLVRPPIPGEP